MANIKPVFILNSTAGRVSDLSVFLLAMLVAIYQIPILSRNLPNVILLGLMALFLITEANRILNLPMQEKILLFILGLYLGLITAYKVLGISTAELYYYFNTVQFFFFLVASVSMIHSLTRRQMKFLLAIAIISIVFTMFHNVVLFLQHGAARYVVLFQEDKYAYNAVDTPFTGAILLLSGTSFICFLHEKKKLLKLALLLLSIFGIYFCVVITQRMIILVLALLMYPLLVFFNTKHKVNRYILFFLAMIVVAVVLLNFKSILLGMAKVIESERILKRINQIIRFVETRDIQAAGGSLTVRFELIFTSWKTFTTSTVNFFLGAGDHRVNNLVIGNHSQLIDELARYGIVGAAIFYPLVNRFLKFVKKACAVKSRTVLNRQVGVLILIFVLRGFLGTVFAAPIGIQMFLVLPLMLDLLQTRAENQFSLIV